MIVLDLYCVVPDYVTATLVDQGTGSSCKCRFGEIPVEFLDAYVLTLLPGKELTLIIDR